MTKQIKNKTVNINLEEDLVRKIKIIATIKNSQIKYLITEILSEFIELYELEKGKIIIEKNTKE